MEKKTRKNMAAVALGREGGKKRAQTLTQEQRSEIARKASQIRWATAAHHTGDIVTYVYVDKHGSQRLIITEAGKFK